MLSRRLTVGLQTSLFTNRMVRDCHSVLSDHSLILLAGFTFCGIAALALAERSREDLSAPHKSRSESIANGNTENDPVGSGVGHVLGEQYKTVRWLVARLTTVIEEDEPASGSEDDAEGAFGDMDSSTANPSSQSTADSGSQSFLTLRS